jgi:hypothetical protein
MLIEAASIRCNQSRKWIKIAFGRMMTKQAGYPLTAMAGVDPPVRPVCRAAGACKPPSSHVAI